MEPEIQRFPWFDTVEKVGQPRDVIWKYKRAIEGHKLVLHSIELFGEIIGNDLTRIFQAYEGHVYSHWGSFPNIFDQSTLGGMALSRYSPSGVIALNNFETKEMTMSMRNRDINNNIRFMAMLWFYEVPMSRAETFEYAVKQPRYKYRHGSLKTLDRFED